MVIVIESIITKHPVVPYFHTGTPSILAPLPHPAVEICFVRIFEAVTDFHTMLEVVATGVAAIQPTDGIGFFHLQ
jgi:hypothetical protein